MRLLGHGWINLLGAAGLVFSAISMGMGTPPQKNSRPAVESGANAVMLKSDVVRATPDARAAELARIEKGLRVRQLANQGGWSQISASGWTGWVRVLSVSVDANAAVDLSDLGALGRTPQGKTVAVAGVRGLDEETLQSATYSESEITRLGGYAMNRGEAEQFAESAGLRRLEMPYLAAPTR
jgi:beta-barrel assembly-enhancing protease